MNMLAKIKRFLTHKKQAKSDFYDPQMIANIRQVEAEYARGEYITWAEMKKELKGGL